MDNNQIIIKKPYREDDGMDAYLKARVLFPDKEQTVFFSVPISYADALAAELADCFVAAAFPWCMTEGYDIVSEAPVSRSILYSLKNRVIPGMSKNSKVYRPISITADPSDLKYESRKYSGLGWSAGVDCFYAYMTNLDAPEGYRPTHLLNINAGVFEEPDIDGKFKRASEKCRKDAMKFGLEALSMNTNLHLVFPKFYLSVYPSRLASCMLAIQKKFMSGLIAGSVELNRMHYNDEVAGFYELIIQNSLSNQNIALSAPGIEVSRAEKIRRIADFEPAQKMLHVCVKSEDRNCMTCDKCTRVIAVLDALGKIDNFGEAFDLDYFREHYDEIWGQVVYGRNYIHSAEALAILKQSGRTPSKRAFIRARMLEAAHKAAEEHRTEILENNG